MIINITSKNGCGKRIVENIKCDEFDIRESKKLECDFQNYNIVFGNYGLFEKSESVKKGMGIFIWK